MENKRFWCEFFDLYRELPALWKIKSADYSNRTLKSSSYQKMVEKLKEIYPEANREMAVKKINSFRTTYRKELKKVKDSQKLGAGTDDIYEPILWYYDKLSFLEDQEECIEGTSTMDIKKEEHKMHIKKKKLSEEDQLIQLACSKLQSNGNSNCDFDMLGKSWALQYQEMDEQQKVIARKLISDILYHGCMGTLQKNHALEI
ncbi:uncharacterized protein [Eurosta solidaginis]|uniref:uncharacterized protein n=1 Tax=Eurosta solidaginis TaxID=178769 RepID=UPI003530E61A